MSEMAYFEEEENPFEKTYGKWKLNFIKKNTLMGIKFNYFACKGITNFITYNFYYV